MSYTSLATMKNISVEFVDFNLNIIYITILLHLENIKIK